MPEKTLQQVPRDLREQYEKGLAALQRNVFDYAIASLFAAVTREPAFYDAREALRAAQHKKAAANTGFFKKVMGGVSNSPMVAKAQMTLRSNPLEAIAACEQILNSDAGNAGAHKVLAEAAIAADLPKTAVLSLRIVLKNSPKDRELTMLLADALAASGQVPEAEAALGELLRLRPADAEVGQLLKNLSARRTMAEGGYSKAAEEDGSYRDLLKDKPSL